MAKFNHQPFEDWIISRGTINREEELALQDHLRQCDDCQRLSEALQKVEISLKTAPELSPSPGFSIRWMDRLAEHRARQQKRQMEIFFLFSAGSALVLLLLVAILLSPVIRSPYPYALALAYQFTLTYSLINTFATAGATLAKAMFNVVPPTMWLSLLVAMTGMVAIWVTVLRKLVYPRRVTL